VCYSNIFETPADGDGRESQFILVDVPKVKMASVNRDSA
jgi:hypothetical protein